MTRLGWLVLAGGFVLLVVGVAVGSSPALVLGLGAVAIVVMAIGFRLRRINLRVIREIQPQRVGREDTALAYFDITNLGAMAVPATVAEQQFGSFDVRVVLPRLGANEQTIRTFRLPTERRGIFPIGPLEAWRSDPFRLVRRSWRYCGNDELWVYPKILAFRPLPTGLARPLEGPTSDTSPQGSITFHRIREYVVGDDLRMIHWKSTARSGTLMVRHNIDTSQPYSVVVVDTRAQRYTADSFELAMDSAASAIAASAAGSAPVQLRFTSGDRIGGPSNRDPLPLLDALTAVQPDQDAELLTELMLLQNERGGTSLTVVTGVAGPSELAVLGRLRRRFQRIVCIVVRDGEDPDEGVGRPIANPMPGLTVIRVADGDSLAAAWNQTVSR